MSTKIVIPLDSLGADQNKDGRVTFGELVRSTLLITALLIITAYGLLAMFGWWAAWRWALLVPWLLGVAIGIWRCIRYEVMFKLGLNDRRRQHRREDWELAQAGGAVRQEANTRGITQDQITKAAIRMIESYYSTGTYARGKVAGISDPLWNQANAQLKKCGLRPGRRVEMAADNAEQAIARYMRWVTSTRQHLVGEDRQFIAN